MIINRTYLEIGVLAAILASMGTSWVMYRDVQDQLRSMDGRITMTSSRITSVESKLSQPQALKKGDKK